jgi:hypothetical protein
MASWPGLIDHGSIAILVTFERQSAHAMPFAMQSGK